MSCNLFGVYQVYKRASHAFKSLNLNEMKIMLQLKKPIIFWNIKYQGNLYDKSAENDFLNMYKYSLIKIQNSCRTILFYNKYYTEIV